MLSFQNIFFPLGWSFRKQSQTIRSIGLFLLFYEVDASLAGPFTHGMSPAVKLKPDPFICFKVTDEKQRRKINCEEMSVMQPEPFGKKQERENKRQEGFSWGFFSYGSCFTFPFVLNPLIFFLFFHSGLYKPLFFCNIYKYIFIYDQITVLITEIVLFCSMPCVHHPP